MTYDTVIAALVSGAEAHPERIAFRFLPGRGAPETMTYAQLLHAVRSRAGAIIEATEPGDRVLILEPAGLDYIASFFAVLAAARIAVPLLPPRSSRNVERLTGVLAASGAEHAFAPPAVRERFAASGLELGLGWLGCGAPAALEAVDPEQIALLQFTSGSTGTPKGVVLRHRQVRANLEQIHAAFPFEEGLTWVGWLPLQHDMGLVGTVLAPVLAGQTSTLMAPETFLMRPVRWLEAISRYGANISGGPDFAYAVCADRVKDADLEGLDLSGWRVAFTGAEPVRAATLRRFAERFRAVGFRPASFYPCYGLAEATLFVAGPDPESGPRSVAFCPRALAEGRLEPSSEGRELVAHGAVRPGQDLAIIDSGRRVPEGQVAEIWIRGPNVASGYHGLTTGAFEQELDGEPGWLRTGDLGAVLDGELFVCGRIKDLILHAGHNIYPQDVERAIEGSDAGFAPNGCVAFSIDDGERERLVAVAELDRKWVRHPERFEALRASARRAVFQAEGVELHELRLLRPGGLPRTTSGKPRRAACKSAFESGELPTLITEMTR